jgi:anaerobic ribonucleoside-triphosphate reductase activating protein
MSDEKLIRLSGIAYESLVNGPGVRRVLFSQGCLHNCKNCHNQSTHSFTGGKLIDIDVLINDIRNNPMLKGVTFSGGDPMEQAEKFAYIAKEIKKTGLNIWCYTGYTFEHIIQQKDKRDGWEELLNYVDVIVDGRFEDEERDSTIRYRGSRNQRIIDVQSSIRTGVVKVLAYD